MNVLIKSAIIVDTNSPFNGKKVDVLIEKGLIQKIGSNVKNPNGYKEIKQLRPWEALLRLLVCPTLYLL